MATGNVQHNKQRRVNAKTVYFDSTDTISRGYALCYDQDATENGSDVADQLGFTVEKPATANLKAFAGFYSGEQGAFTGPGYITIHVPDRGEMFEAFTDANMTALTTIMGPQNGSYALAGLTAATAFEDGAVVRAGVTENTDTVNALSTVYML